MDWVKNFVLGVSIIFIVFILVNWAIGVTPEVYAYFWGDVEVNQYLLDEVMNKSNSSVIALQILKFTDQKNGRITWFYDKNATIIGLGWVVYEVDGSYRLFIRGTEESWILKTGLGNCGEVSWFFSKMMNRSGYHSNSIFLYDHNGRGHQIAEYLDENNERVYVDPFAGNIIPDIHEYSKWWVYAETVDFNNNIEETTKEVINNTHKLNIKISENAYFKTWSKITIIQNGPKIVSKDFSTSDTHEIYLKHHNYTIIEEKDFKIIKFTKKEKISLTKDRTYNIDTENILKLENIEITSALKINTAIVILIYACYLLKKYQKNK